MVQCSPSDRHIHAAMLSKHAQRNTNHGNAAHSTDTDMYTYDADTCTEACAVNVFGMLGRERLLHLLTFSWHLEATR